MKKYFALLALALSATTFASTASTGKEASATMNITANVIKPLTVTSGNDIKFGNVIPGTNPTESSNFTVEGEPGSNIKVTFPETRFTPEGSYETSLKNGDNSMKFLFNIGDESAAVATLNLGDTGKLNVPIASTLYVGENQARGAYSGNITLRAIYE